MSRRKAQNKQGYREMFRMTDFDEKHPKICQKWGDYIPWWGDAEK